MGCPAFGDGLGSETLLLLLLASDIERHSLADEPLRGDLIYLVVLVVVNGAPGIPIGTRVEPRWPGIKLKTILAINPGDDVVAWLTVVNRKLMYLAIFNLNAGTYSSFWWAAPKVPWPTAPMLLQAEISGATAEWVMERPMVWASDMLYELPDYFPGVAATRAATRIPRPGVYS